MSKGDISKCNLQKGLEYRMEQLSPVKRRLLEIQFKGRTQTPAGIMQAAGESGLPAPLSYNQQRLWFLDRLRPNSAQYNVYRAWRIDGPLDMCALDAALQAILNRHQVLKMRIRESNGAWIQDTNASAEVSTTFVDLGSSPRQDRENIAIERITEAARTPFDLSAGPFLRAMLVKLAGDQHVLLIVLHHIVADGWSCRVLRDELTRCYEAFRRGQIPELPELPLQYTDFARYQRASFSGRRRASLLSYWREQLSGSLDPLDLQTDFPRPAIQSDRGNKLQFDLGPELSETVHEFCREHDITLFILLTALLNVLLHRYTGALDILIGSPIANRTLPELESLIGFITNTNVLRTDLSGNPGFMEIVRRVKKVALDAYSYQDMPFEELVAELHQDRDLSRTPLFQVAFVLQNTPEAGLHFQGTRVTPIKISNGTSKFDLSLCINIKNGNLSGFWEYCTDLFEQASIVCLAEHYRTLLVGALADPAQAITGLPLLTDSERRQLLEQWNATAIDYPRDQCIHHLFEAQVALTPDATALVMDEQRVSYEELNALANQLAHHLRKLGIGPDSLVGIAMHRSIELVTGILGILKAGGAYVPLDSAYPRERLAFMLRDTNVQVLLTEQSLLSRFTDCTGQTVCLDRDWPLIAQEEQDNPPHQTVADNLAYVMYTSGSTGTPKGVMVPHRAVLRLVCGADYVRLDANRVHLLLAPLSFDASTFELWGALLHGARCIIFAQDVPAIERLGSVIQRQRVTTLWLTASLFNMIIDEAPQILSGVQQLLTGGEALSVSHVRRALESLPGTAFVNGYGPTESTTFACCYPIPRVLDERLASVPIGRPIANTKVYVLDRNRNPVPVGVRGELYIGGEGLARGYLNQVELTAEKFIENPFSEDRQSRLYKTGDEVRYLPDGNIEFLGRTDHQIKIRGFRVEPGEIESALEGHFTVRKSLVAVGEDRSGEKRLLAYVVGENGRKPDAVQLGDYLKERVPNYMLPAHYLFLEALPLSPNGKIDRDTLPQPDESLAEATFIAPRNSTEQCIAEIWCTLLKLERVGVHDNFFGLGGHSLLAVQLLNRLEAGFDIKVPLDVIFDFPSVAELAAYLDAALWADFDVSSMPGPGSGLRESGEL